MIKVNKLFPLVYCGVCFLKETEIIFFVCLSSYKNTRESLGKLKKAVELWKHLSMADVLTAFLILPNFHSCFCNLIQTRHMFSIS